MFNLAVGGFASINPPFDNQRLTGEYAKPLISDAGRRAGYFAVNQLEQNWLGSVSFRLNVLIVYHFIGVAVTPGATVTIAMFVSSSAMI